MLLWISRVGAGLLLFNLTLAGQDLACAHEAQALDHPVSVDHAGSASHGAKSPADSPPDPCDGSASQCCDAVASCAISGIPGVQMHDPSTPDLRLAVIAAADTPFDSTPLEVATPPPRPSRTT